jgi:hypothetical protein
MAPACTDDSDCTALGVGYVCAAKAQKWCRNSPDTACGTNDDCPVCPTNFGTSPAPCSRLCETRSLKLYVNPGSTARLQMSDLFLDPDEKGLDSGDASTLVGGMSNLSGQYGGAMRRLNCCIDDWWPDIVTESGTQCTTGFSCPVDFSCD